jgi:hypothetical protein
MTHRPARIVLLLLLSALSLAALPVAAGAAPSFVDSQVKANILLLQGYINAAAIKSEFVYPAVATVKQGGGLVAPIWPANPWTGKTMVPAKSRGNFTYSLTASGYRLVGHLSKGTYVVSGGLPAWLRDERNVASRIGVTLIAEYVQRYADSHAGALPVVAQVAAAGAVGTQIGVFWPMDPWTGAAMTQGTAPGHYTYLAGSGGAFTLRVHLAGGTSWPAPGH